MIPKILDRFEKDIGLLPDCIEGIAIEERNGMCEVEITYPIFSLNWNKLLRGNIIVCNVNDTLINQMFRIYKVSKPLNGKIKVYARHIFFDLARDFIENVELSNASCEYALNTLFRNSQFSQGFSGHSNIINAQDYNISNVNLIKALGGTQCSILDTFGTGAEILRDNKNVYVLNRRGHDNGVTIEYSKNMTGLNIEFDDSKLITRIKPIAKYRNEDNKQVTVFSEPKYIDSPLIFDYETPFIKEIDFTDKFKDGEVPTPEKLKILAEKYFIENKCDQVKNNIKVEFIPLSKCVGYKNIQDKISLCDTVTIKDYRYNLNTQEKVIKTYYDFIAERYEKMELGEARTNLGDLIGGSNEGKPGPPGADGADGKPGVDGNIGDFPNSLPTIPVLRAKVLGFASVDLSWTFENKVYYSYEVYASKKENFTPNTFDLIFEGQASSFLHQVKPSEVWYYKACGVNSYGDRTGFSQQVKVTTNKVDDFDTYFSSLAVDKLVASVFTADYMEAGIIKGAWIDAKNLSVTDGNGKRTLGIDSFGNVNLDVSNFKVKSENIFTQNETNDKINTAIKDYKVIVDKEFEESKESVDNLKNLTDTVFKDGIVTVAEKEAIKNQKVVIEKEHKDVIAQANALINVSDLVNTSEKTELNTSKIALENSYLNIVKEIDKITGVKSVKSSLVVNPTTYEFSPTEKIVIRHNNSNVTYSYLYGLDGVISSESYASNTITFPIYDKKGTYNCYFGTYIANEWTQSNDFTITIKDKEVTPPPPTDVEVISVSLNKTSINKKVGETETLIATVNPSNATNKNIVWSSSNSSIASVSTGGVVTCRAKGNADIIAKSNNNKQVSCSVRVTEDVVIPPVDGEGLTNAINHYNATLKILRDKMQVCTDLIAQVKADKVLVQARKEVKEVSDALSNLQSDFDKISLDGIVDEAEAKIIADRIVQLDKEKLDVNSQYLAIYNNADLTGNAKSNLASSKSTFDTAHTNLVSAINTVILDKKVTEIEKIEVKSKTNAYNLAISDFSKKLGEASSNISQNQANKVDNKYEKRCSSIEQNASSIGLNVNKTMNAGIKNLVAYTDFEAKNLIKENWWVQGTGNWYESENANLIGFQNNYSTETMIHSKAIKDFESKISIFADIKIENADCEIMILGSRSDELDYAYTLSALRFTTKHTQDKKWLEAITIPPNIKTLWVRIDNEGVKTGDTNKNNTIFVNALTLVNGDIARKEKILNGSEIAGISIKSNEIELSVKEKVDEKELISKINMSSEEIKIAAAKLSLEGFVTFAALTGGNTTIVGGNLNTCNINAANIQGKSMVYIEENGVLSCDGNTYIRDFFVPETHPLWHPDSRGSFSVAPTGYFSKDLHIGNEVYTKGTGVVRRENGVFIQVDALGVQSGDPSNYLLVKGYQSNHVFGVDLWYSDEKLKENITNLKTRPVKNVLTGLELIKNIEHYSYNYKESVGLGTGQVECGYIAQQLQKVSSSLVREVKQQDDSINLEPVASAIIPHLTKAIQEQQSYIESLEVRLLKLEQLI